MRDLPKNGLEGIFEMLEMIYVLNIVVITKLCICSNSQDCVPKGGKIFFINKLYINEPDLEK